MDLGVLFNNGRMNDEPEQFKANSRVLDVNPDYGFSIKADENKC